MQITFKKIALLLLAFSVSVFCNAKTHKKAEELSPLPPTVVSGPEVRIPGITVPTVIRVNGFDSSPVRWKRSGTIVGSGHQLEVINGGSYFAEANISTTSSALWVSAGSIEVPELVHYIGVNGPNPPNPSGTLSELCIVSNASQYMVSKNWMFNGQGEMNTGNEPVCRTLWKPGHYTGQLTYQFGNQSVVLTTPVREINAATSAPSISRTKLTVDPVTGPAVFTVTNYSTFSSVWWYKDNEFGGLMSGPTVEFTMAGRYYFFGVIAGSGYAYSYEFVVTKVSIPAPVVVQDQAELTIDDPELRLRVGGNYNSGYTWSYEDGAIANSNSQFLDVRKPGSYKVVACATHSDGELECRSSVVIKVTGRGPVVNYMSKSTTRHAGIFTVEQLDTMSKESVNHVTGYADGFARPLQSIARENSPGGRDVVALSVYDHLGREQKKYLPFVSTSTTGKYRYIKPSSPTPVIDFYQQANDHIANTTTAYASTVFESSPLNRVTEQGSVGEDWQPGTSHTMRTKYGVNDVAAGVLLWKENIHGELVAVGKYGTGSLLINELTNENGSMFREFFDKTGNKVLVESPGEGDQRLRTYYVYDDLKRLTHVVPPQVSMSATSTPFTVSAAQKKECYLYGYDQRSRVVEKHIPGAEPLYYIYDPWDRIVLSQTGNQRFDNRWNFMKYDAQDRAVIEGETTILGTHSGIQQSVNSFYNSYGSNTSLRFEEINSDTHDYTNRSFPVLYDQSGVNRIFYYDDYSFLSSDTTVYAFEPHPDLHLSTAFIRVKGLTTGVKQRILGTTDFLTMVTYYDNRYRTIQVITDHHLGGRDILSSQYDFEGKINKTRLDHSGTSPIVIVEEYVYDFAGRLLHVNNKINDQAPVTLFSNSYNELGQVISKNLHKEGNSFWQSQDYEYNIRGWLTGMNKPASEPESLYPDMYGFTLAYNESMPDFQNIKQYNGNISSYKEVRPFEMEGSQQVQQGYQYQYDAADRLKTASFRSVSNPSANNAFNENLHYDVNGNITSLVRTGVVDGSQQTIDQLTYTYTGNQLQNVSDAGNREVGFKDVTNPSDYSYDANGNMVRDGNKMITKIEYNVLNLPSRVNFKDGRYMKFSYTASGEKLSQVTYQSDTVKERYDYVKTLLYKDNKVESIQHAEGRMVRSQNDQWKYEYNLKDHLGNVRTTFTTGVEENVYTATLEAEDTEEESSVFGESYGQAVKYTSHLFNNTKEGEKSVRLSGANMREMVALAKSVKVMAGDQIRMEVSGKYHAPTSTATHVEALMLASLANSFGISAGSPGEGGMAYQALTSLNQAGLLLHTAEETERGPKAFLNYILFDSNFVPYDGGFVQLDGDALENGSNVSHDHMVLHTGMISRSGYAYMYLSNESETITDVFFDDFTITHTPSPIVEATTYYPFGLTATRNSAEDMTQQRHQYNGKEQLTEEGLDWYDYGARMYDAALGRWNAIDPMAEKYAAMSPYNYVANNPLKFVDPDGRDAQLIIDHTKKTATVQATYYTSKDAKADVEKGTKVWNDMSGKHSAKIGKENYKLNFKLTVVEKDNPKSARSASAIDATGNSVEMMSGSDFTGPTENTGAVTHSSKRIIIPDNVKEKVSEDQYNLLVAHEVGHTIIGKQEEKSKGTHVNGSEHTSGTVMDKGTAGVQPGINKEVIENIVNSYPQEGKLIPRSDPKLKPIHVGGTFIKKEIR